MGRKNLAFDQSRYKDWIDPAEVTPYENNAKKHDERQIRDIANSIKRFGWRQECVLTKDNVLVIGHGRWQAALKLGCKMPYQVIDAEADELTEDDIRELRDADNLTNAMTGFDEDLLSLDFSELSFEGFDFDLGDFGIGADDLVDTDEEERSGNLSEKYLVPPFSVIYGNKPDWLKRKRDWINFGIRSELGRGGDLLSIRGATRRQTSYKIGGGRNARKPSKTTPD